MRQFLNLNFLYLSEGHGFKPCRKSSNQQLHTSLPKASAQRSACKNLLWPALT